MVYKIGISGFGKVSKEFLKLISDKSDFTYRRHGLRFVVIFILGKQKIMYNKNGIELKEIAHIINSDSKTSLDLPKSILNKNGISSIEIDNLDAIIESTPTNLVHGQPGLNNILFALKKGINVVSLTKGPFILDYDNIIEIANKNMAKIKFSGTTAAALPAHDIINFSLSGASIVKLEGILNGTTNYILTKMTQEGWTFDKSLEIAQEKGIAESDPSLDINGYDTASKIYILAKACFNNTFDFKDIEIKGINGLPIDEIIDAKSKGFVYKLIGSAYLENDIIKAKVRPCKIDNKHPLFYIDDSNKGITYYTDTLGDITITGGASSPKAAAASAYKDLINIFK